MDRLARLLLRLLPTVLMVGACAPDVTVIGTLEESLAVPESPAFVSTVQALKDSGWEGGKNVRYQRRNAEARSQPLEQLAGELRAAGPAIILVFSPEALEAELRVSPDTPVAFTLQGEDAARVADAALKRGTKVVGAATPPLGERAVVVARTVAPGSNSLGLLFDPAVPNWEKVAASARLVGQSDGIDVRLQSVRRGEDAAAAARRLIEQGAGCLIVLGTGMDLKAVLQAATEKNIPVITAQYHGEASGATASIAVDEAALGKRTGEMAAQVLSGQLEHSQAMVSDTFYMVTYDRAVAAKLGISLP
jgi:putative ABC transport system substrate-binding protein